MKGDHNRLKTACKRGHEFTPENTCIRPSGARRCRACNRLELQRVAERRKRGLPAGRNAEGELPPLPTLDEHTKNLARETWLRMRRAQ